MYKVGKQKFFKKEEIKDHVRLILDNHYKDPSPTGKYWEVQPITDEDDIDFLKELVTHYGDFKFNKDEITGVGVKYSESGFILVVSAPGAHWRKVSIHKCVDNVKLEREDVYYFGFGKYCGKYIDEIDDDSYFVWILQSSLDKSIKDKVYEYLNTRQQEMLLESEGSPWKLYVQIIEFNSFKDDFKNSESDDRYLNYNEIYEKFKTEVKEKFFDHFTIPINCFISYQKDSSMDGETMFTLNSVNTNEQKYEIKYSYMGVVK